MTIIQMRNTFAAGLYQGLSGLSVLRSDQPAPETDPPYVYYQPIQACLPLGGALYSYNGDQVTRTEYTEATISVSVVSYDRVAQGLQVYGDDEALAWAEAAVSWLGNQGSAWFMAQGIAIIDIGAVQDRTAVQADAVMRRYGFDVRLRYTRVTRAACKDIAAVVVAEERDN